MFSSRWTLYTQEEWEDFVDEVVERKEVRFYVGPLLSVDGVMVWDEKEEKIAKKYSFEKIIDFLTDKIWTEILKRK